MKLFRKYLLAFLLFFASTCVVAAGIDPSVIDCIAMYGNSLRVESLSTGPRMFLKAENVGLRNFDDIKELKIGQYNVENLYNYQGKWEVDPITQEKKLLKMLRPKPEKRIRNLIDVIQRSDDDIMVLEEVEDLTAAKEFIRESYGDQYRPVLIKGNDSRGINIAIFIKKDLPFDIEIQSNKNYSLNSVGMPIFSRDLPILTIRKAGSSDDDKPIASFIGTHFKSQRDSPGDPGGKNKRKLQVRAAVEIIKNYQNLHPGIPIFFLGDFNADVRTASELNPIWDMGFMDSFDLSQNYIPKKERVTQSFFPKKHKVVHSQLDAILVNKSGQNMKVVKTAEIIPYKKSDGTDRELPTSPKERKKQGSDHWKLRVVLDFEKMREAWKK